MLSTCEEFSLFVSAEKVVVGVITVSSDETGVSGEGVVIEGVLLATGQCIAHWLYPRPKGSIAIFDSMNDFVTVHIKPHPANRTIITYDDGEQERYGLFTDEEKPNENNEVQA